MDILSVTPQPAAQPGRPVQGARPSPAMNPDGKAPPGTPAPAVQPQKEAVANRPKTADDKLDPQGNTEQGAFPLVLDAFALLQTVAARPAGPGLSLLSLAQPGDRPVETVTPSPSANPKEAPAPAPVATAGFAGLGLAPQPKANEGLPTPSFSDLTSKPFAGAIGLPKGSPLPAQLSPSLNPENLLKASAAGEGPVKHVAKESDAVPVSQFDPAIVQALKPSQVSLQPSLAAPVTAAQAKPAVVPVPDPAPKPQPTIVPLEKPGAKPMPGRTVPLPHVQSDAPAPDPFNKKGDTQGAPGFAQPVEPTTTESATGQSNAQTPEKGLEGQTQPAQVAVAKQAQTDTPDSPVQAEKPATSIGSVGAKPKPATVEDRVKADAVKAASPQPSARPDAPVAASVSRDPLPKLVMESVHRQIADRVAELFREGRFGSVVLKLQPEEMGSIRLQVQAVHGRVTAKIDASDESLRAALATNQRELAQTIETRGLSLASLQVGQEQAGRHQAAHAPAEAAEAVRQAHLRQASIEPSPVLQRLSPSGVDFLA